MITNKKIKLSVFLFFILIILSFGGYFFYEYNEYKKEIEASVFEIPSIVDHESVNNYKIIETEEGKKVINENAGLSFMVPNDWNIEKIGEENEIELVSHDMDSTGLGSETAFPLNGCIIRVGVVYSKEEYTDHFESIKEKIGKKEINPEAEELIIIDSLNGLKTIKFNKSDIGRIILVELPINNILYHIGVNFRLENQPRCLHDFNQILETISINI